MNTEPFAGPEGVTQNFFCDTGQVVSRTLRLLALLALLMNAISSILFISTVKRPVYDDLFNIFDVHNYASHGLSTDTLLSQRNPPGPSSFLWMAVGVHLLGGDELKDARIAILVSWVLLGTGILVGARQSTFPHLWYGALLVTLVFPHTVESMGTLLTEGPALLFAVLGTLAWTEFASRPSGSPGLFVLGMLGGLAMGVAVTCRQYYLALLPAAGCFAVHEWWRHPREGRRQWSASLILSLILAAIPVLLMVLIWKGISSPGMATGTSYNHMYTAAVGRNLSRPLVAAFYVALYLLPLAFPAMFRLKTSQRRVALFFAVVGGASLTYFNGFFLQPGPLNSLIRIASRLPHGGTVFFALLAVFVVYNAVAVCFLLYEQRDSISTCAPVLFALLAIVFFVAEQIGVGGNLPFYDRYILQIAPFLGLLAFALLPRLTATRLLALGCLSVLSHFMLWRFVFAG